jgi:hypothetical protein
MDVYSTNWNEADASNSTAAPDGWPEGMAPSGVNDSGRAMMGATKRFVDQQIPLLTGGTSTAYTLAYAVTPSQLYDGMTHLVQFNAVNGVAPTLNVNALGAKPIHFYGGAAWGACPANMFAVDQIARVAYNAAAGTYRVIGVPMVLRQSVSGVSVIDFTGIPSNVNDLEIRFDLLVGTNGANLEMQFYNSGGTLDSGNNYFYSKIGFLATSSSPVVTSVGATSAIELLANINNSANHGCSGIINILNIQGTKYTQCNLQADALDGDGSTIKGATGYGIRQVAGPITGVRIFVSTGTFAGKFSVAAK